VPFFFYKIHSIICVRFDFYKLIFRIPYGSRWDVNEIKMLFICIYLITEIVGFSKVMSNIIIIISIAIIIDSKLWILDCFCSYRSLTIISFISIINGFFYEILSKYHIIWKSSHIFWISTFITCLSITSHYFNTEWGSFVHIAISIFNPIKFLKFFRIRTNNLF